MSAPDGRRPANDTSDAPPARSRPDTSATAPDGHRPANNTSDAPPARSRPDTSATAPDGHRPANDTSDAPPARSRPDTSATGWLRSTADGVAILITASPRASRTEIAGVAEGRLRVRVAAPPVEGEANTELVRFLAKALGVPRSSVTVTGGRAGRRKTVLIRGIGLDAARRLNT